jgi:hypothetical protein
MGTVAGLSASVDTTDGHVERELLAHRSAGAKRRDVAEQPNRADGADSKPLGGGRHDRHRLILGVRDRCEKEHGHEDSAESVAHLRFYK